MKKIKIYNLNSEVTTDLDLADLAAEVKFIFSTYLSPSKGPKLFGTDPDCFGKAQIVLGMGKKPQFITEK